MNRFSKYILLLIVCTLSFYGISQYSSEISIEKRFYNQSYLVFPAIIYTFFLFFLFRDRINLAKALIYFFILVLFYYISVYAGSVSWGIYIPFIGLLGSGLLGVMFKLKTKGLVLFGLGFLSSFLGVLLSLCVLFRFDTGIAFGMVVIPWQLAMGAICIKDSERIADKENDPVSSMRI